jgi:hypothetical protein
VDTRDRFLSPTKRNAGLPVIAQAASAAHTSQAGGLFLLAWGLTASVAGLAGITNFRGFTDNFARRAAVSSAGLRKLPPWKYQQPSDQARQTKVMRLTAVPFAIIGPIVTVTGIIAIIQGHAASRGFPALPGSLSYLFTAFTAAAVGWSWLSRRGYYRPAVQRGGWRLATAILSSLGALIFGVSFATGQLTTGFVAWGIGGLSAMILMIGDKTTGTGSGSVRD